MISILTVTKRNGWLRTAIDSLISQTHRNFEWVIVYEPTVEHQQLDQIKNHKWVPAPKKVSVSNLNRATNEGLRHCTGQYVLFYQDFIELQPDTIERLLANAKPNRFITTATRNPDGQFDARYTDGKSFRPIEPKEWECNVALAPMKGLRAIGGFDETYDDGWSWDNCSVAERAHLLDYGFFIDEGVQPQLLYHRKEPELRPDMPLNGEYHETVMRKIRHGELPVALPYL